EIKKEYKEEIKTIEEKIKEEVEVEIEVIEKEIEKEAKKEIHKIKKRNKIIITQNTTENSYNSSEELNSSTSQYQLEETSISIRKNINKKI
ncbi:8232_t:CDS:1, partial [Cetraspora pellucida]